MDSIAALAEPSLAIADDILVSLARKAAAWYRGETGPVENANQRDAILALAAIDRGTKDLLWHLELGEFVETLLSHHLESVEGCLEDEERRAW